MYGTPNKSREGRRLPSWLIAAAVVMTIPVVWLIAATIDTSALGLVWDNILDRPQQLALAVLAFAAAFGIRAVAWSRVLPDLPISQSWAGLHMTLLGNHLLPLRMGEPLRVVSVVRRAGIDWPRATASTVTLRAADMVAIAGLGVVAGIGAVTAWWAIAGVLAVGSVVVIVGATWLRRLRRTGEVRLPGLTVISMTVAAWALESVVMYQVASWVGLDIGVAGAVLITSAAVVAQIAAFAPGGIGTYEAGGVAAMVFLGFDPALGLAVVVSAHAIKTAYSLLLGAVAFGVPSPGMIGRLRLSRLSEPAPPVPATGKAKPVVLFMPAYNEADSVAAVVRRVPSKAAGREVICLVIDDGSTDETAELAREAGASVVELPANRGLGAAVRTGFEEALKHDPAAVAFCDADGEYAPEELDKLVAPILEGQADYVVGSRFDGEIERMLPHRRFGNLVLTRLLSWVARRRISDGQSGYRAFSPRAVTSAEVIHDFNYAQVLTLDLLAKGMTYAEVPISYRFRTTGESFIKLGRYLRAVVPAVYREVNTA